MKTGPTASELRGEHAAASREARSAEASPIAAFPGGGVATAAYGFWFLNDAIEQDELRRQLGVFKESGFAGVVIHARDGLRTPYLSERWFAAIRTVLDAASRLSLACWFYDENPYPSGLLGGRLLDDAPAAGARTLVFGRWRCPSRDGVLACGLDDTRGLLRAFARPVGRGAWRDVTRWCGLVGVGWRLQGYREVGYGPMFAGKRATPRHWRGWNDRYRWQLEAEVDREGEYEVLAIGRAPKGNYRYGGMPDMLDAAAMRRFLDGVYGETERALGPERFARFAASFTDEPQLAGPWPWHDDLPAVYRELFDDDLFAAMPRLIEGEDEPSRQARRRYRSAVSTLWGRSFFEPMANWLRGRGVPLTGHVSPEEDPLLSTEQTPRLRDHLARFDLPGYDLVTLPFGELEEAKLVGPRQISGIAHRLGRRHLMVEMGGCCGEDLTLAGLRRLVDWLAMHGFDRYVLHGQFYSLAGPRKREAPPSCFEQQPYWRLASGLTRYIDRVASWIGRTRPHRPLAVVVPWSGFEALIEPQQHGAETARRLARLVGALSCAGLDFDLIADDAVDAFRLQAGDAGLPAALRFGEACYATLIRFTMPEQDPGVRNGLAAFAARGLESPEVDAGGDEVAFDASIERVRRQAVARHRAGLEIGEDLDLRVACRRGDHGVERLFWNPGDAAVTITLHDAQHAVIVAMDDSIDATADDGPGHSVRLVLPPWHSVLVRPGPAARQGRRRPARWRRVEARWPDGWELLLPPANALTLRSWRMGQQSVRVPAEHPERWPHPARLETRAGANVVICRWHWIAERGGLIDAVAWEANAAVPAWFELNGHRLAPAGTVTSRGIEETRYPAGEAATEGRNELAWVVPDHAWSALHACDPPRLLGAFLVHGEPESDAVRLEPMPGPALAMDQPRPWTDAGLPHFSGTLTYQATLAVPTDLRASRIVLTAHERQRDAFSVEAAGVPAGCCLWPGQAVGLSASRLAEPGGVPLRFTVSNTLANRLAGQPCRSGLVAAPRVMAMD